MDRVTVAVQDGYRTGRMQDRSDEGHIRYRTVQMQDRTDAVQDEYRTGGCRKE